MTAQPPQHQVSPESTGGAGTIDEYSLGAVALARLLTGDLLPGLTAPPDERGAPATYRREHARRSRAAGWDRRG